MKSSLLLVLCGPVLSLVEGSKGLSRAKLKGKDVE